MYRPEEYVVPATMSGISSRIAAERYPAGKQAGLPKNLQGAIAPSPEMLSTIHTTISLRRNALMKSIAERRVPMAIKDIFLPLAILI